MQELPSLENVGATAVHLEAPEQGPSAANGWAGLVYVRGPGGPVADSTDKLERLFTLFKEGALTREEFEQQKAAALATATGSSPAQLPEQIGAYRILGLIGQGGMGAVYRARHLTDAIAARQGGDVALKVMHAQLARDPRFEARFQREASLGLKLDHPGIVGVHDLVLDAGRLGLVMELVEGRSLAQVIGHEVGPIPWRRARPMIERLLDAVEHAHGKGVIHRDLKPDNVVVCADGSLKILDFGIAKEVGASGATVTGTGLGTIDYMAPEQHTDASRVDERADVYALGMTLYEMLAGRLPWGDGMDAVGVLQAKLGGDIPPPTSFYPDIPSQVVAAVMAALVGDRDRRTASVAALRASLAPPPPAPPVGQPARRQAPVRSGPATARRRPRKAPEPPARSSGRSLIIAGMVISAVSFVALAILVAVFVLPLDRGGPGVASPRAVEASPAVEPDIDEEERERIRQEVREQVEAQRAALIAEQEQRDATPAPTPVRTRAPTPRATPAPTPRPTPAPVAPGTATFNSAPWSMVIVDGRALGPTPVVRYELAAGSHTVVFDCSACEPPTRRSREFEVESGENEKVTVRFEQ